MKRKRAIVFLISVCMVCIIAGLLSACGGEELDYKSNSAPNSNGNSGVEVVYELEGGTYQNTQHRVRMYYYIPAGGETLISPPGENSKREILRANYHILGWYKTKTENADGTVSYSDEWDFETDTIKSGDESLTLYCGWAANVRHSFDICYIDENGNEQTFTSIETQAGMTFTDSSNRADNRPGYTAERAKNANGSYEIVYYSKDASGELVPWDPAYTHPGGETSTAVKVFVKYIAGDFKYVSTAEEYIAAAKNYSRNREGVWLCNDIDLGGEEVDMFRDGAGKFSSVFYGNNFTVKNFKIHYNVNWIISNQQQYLGDKALCIALFGNLDGATIENVTFEDVVLDVNISYSQINGVYIAPLAVLSSQSAVKNVTVKEHITSSGVHEHETERLFWQEGVTGDDCTAEIQFSDETQS